MEKLLNRKQKQLPKEGIDFRFAEVLNFNEPVTAIEVIDGPYKNVIYCYGVVRVLPPDNPGEPAILSFDYRIHYLPTKNLSFSMVKGDEFKQFAGDVLMSIFLHNEDGEYATIREHDTEESNLS